MLRSPKREFVRKPRNPQHHLCLQTLSHLLDGSHVHHEHHDPTENTTSVTCHTQPGPENNRGTKRGYCELSNAALDRVEGIIREIEEVLADVRVTNHEDKAVAIAQELRRELQGFIDSDPCPSDGIRERVIGRVLEHLGTDTVSHSTIWSKSYRRWMSSCVRNIYQLCEGVRCGEATDREDDIEKEEVVTLMERGRALGRSSRRLTRDRPPDAAPTVRPAGPRSHSSTQSFVYFNQDGSVHRSVHPSCSGEPTCVAEAVGVLCDILGLESEDPDPQALPSFVAPHLQNNLLETMCTTRGRALMHRDLHGKIRGRT